MRLGHREKVHRDPPAINSMGTSCWKTKRRTQQPRTGALKGRHTTGAGPAQVPLRRLSHIPRLRKAGFSRTEPRGCSTQIQRRTRTDVQAKLQPILELQTKWGPEEEHSRHAIDAGAGQTTSANDVQHRKHASSSLTESIQMLAMSNNVCPRARHEKAQVVRRAREMAQTCSKGPHVSAKNGSLDHSTLSTVPVQRCQYARKISHHKP